MSNIDLSNLTGEQREYIKNLEAQLAAKDAAIAEKDNIIAQKDNKIAAQLKEIEKLKLLIETKTSTIKQYNIERFVTKADPRPNGLDSTVSKSSKPSGRAKGSKNFGEDYLEELSKLNKPITLDIAKSMNNATLTKIDEESTYLVKRIKASVRVYKVIIPVYKGSDNKIYRAENNLSPIHHSIVASSLLSDAIAMKYFLGVPEYRYAKWLASENLPFSQKTLNNWRLQAAKVLTPFYEYIKAMLSDKSLDISNIHIDETWLDVVDNKKLGRDKSYVFCYSAKTNKGKVPLFEFSTTRQTKSVENNLSGYDQTITIDGYAGYNSVGTGKITKQRCMVHARREFANIVKTLNKEQQKKSKAYEIVNKFDLIFHEESVFKEMHYDTNSIKEQRNTPLYKALVDDLNNSIAALNPEKNSMLDKACKYWNNLNGEQWTYLNNGNIELDNNEAERQAKKFVIDRKNFLFAKSEKGAISSCILMTLIDLAYENNYDPRDYLEYLLDNVQAKDFKDLLPWSNDFKNYMKNIQES